MKYKKPIIIGASAGIISISGVTAAAVMHQSNQTDHPKKSTTTITTHDTDGNEIKVETTTPDPEQTDATPESTQTTPPASTTTTPPAQVSPVDQFHQAVSTKSAIIYPLSSLRTTMSLDEFTKIQYWCLYDRATAEVKSQISEEELNAKLGFFEPIGTTVNGQPRYNYFRSYACQVDSTY
jgi:hypothetical protein